MYMYMYIEHRHILQFSRLGTQVHLCLHVCIVQVWCIGSGFPSSTTNLASVLYTCTCIFKYMYMYMHLDGIIVQVASFAHLCQSSLSSPLLQTLPQSFLLLFTHIQRNHLLHCELTATLRENNGRGDGRDGGVGG